MVDRSASWAKTSVTPGRWPTSAQFQIRFQINLTRVERQNTVQERSVCEPAAESISAEVSSADPKGVRLRPRLIPCPCGRAVVFAISDGHCGRDDRGRSDRCAVDVGKTTALARGGEYDGPEMGWFDSLRRAAGPRKFPVRCAIPGHQDCSPIGERRTLLVEGLRGHQVASTVTKPTSLALRTLDPEEIAVLVNRGQELLSTGDVVAARVVLLRAAEARDPKAALALAGTLTQLCCTKSASTVSSRPTSRRPGAGTRRQGVRLGGSAASA